MNISLKPVMFPLPKDVSPIVRKTFEKAEAAIRDNNRLIERAIQNVSTTVVVADGGTATLDANNILHIS